MPFRRLISGAIFACIIISVGGVLPAAEVVNDAKKAVNDPLYQYETPSRSAQANREMLTTTNADPGWKQARRQNKLFHLVHHRRAKAYALAQQAWVDHHCSLTSSQRELYNDMISLRLDEFKENLFYHKQFTYELWPATAVTFGRVSRTFANSVWTDKVKSILSPEQQERLKSAIEEREAWQSSALCEYAFGQLDEALHFTDQQHAQVKTHIRSRLPIVDSPFLSMNTSNTLLPYSHSLELVELLPQDELSDSQRSLLSQLNARKNNFNPLKLFHLPVHPENPARALTEALKNIEVQEERKIVHAAIAYVDEIIADKSLTAQEERKLQLAARGATRYLIEEQRQSLLKSYELKLERDAGRKFEENFRYAFVFEPPLPSVVTQHPILADVVNSLGNLQEYQQQREHDQHQARVDLLVTLLDRELWLTIQQRSELQAKLGQVLLPGPFENEEGLFEIAHLAVALRQISLDQAKEQLHAPQLLAWCQMKNQFDFVKNRTALRYADDRSMILHLPRYKD